MITMEELLALLVRQGGSDLHISVGTPPRIRIDGELLPVEHAPLSPEESRRLATSVLTSDQIDIAERFTGKGGLKGADRFVGAQWSTRASGVPLLADALAAIDCEVEDIVERHSHAIVIGRVLDVAVSARTAALAYWQGRYVAIDQDEDAVKLAEVGVPAPHTGRRF